jgi:signal transduction histidine kinase
VSQSRSADAVPSVASADQRTADPVPAPRNRRVAWMLIVLVAVPVVLALALTGLRVTDATRKAGAYGQVGRLAALGQQVTGLAQAMAEERSGAAAFISNGRPAAGLPALRRQSAITDRQAARVRRLVSQLGHAYPAQTRAGAAQVLASIAKLPGLRTQTAQSQASALAVITGYSAATAGLFPVNDGIADLSGNFTLITSVRALGSLSRMIDHASQQQAILGVALAEGRFEPGALTALTTAQARQASDVASFRNSATTAESWALTETLARPPARQAQAVEQRAIAAGNGGLALGAQASQQWSAGMSYRVGWMGHAQQQLGGWITADAQALQRSAMRSALITGGAALGALALVVLGILLTARSMMRRQRQLEAPALAGAGAPLPSSVSTVSAGFVWRSHSLVERLLRLIDSSELNEDDPERLAKLSEMDHLATRIWRNADSALVLAGHEPSRPAEPLALVDMLRAATSEMEEYERVILDVQPGVCVSGSAATDTVHLLAELLENATTFSPEATEVIVSGHAVYGGGSLITITDGGTGMSEEELTLLNRQLANPSLADVAVAQPMGLRTVALLAAQHGITVTLSTPPDGGTTTEVYLPAALISVDAEPGAWRRRAGEAPLATASEKAGASVTALPFSARKFASGPEPPSGAESAAPEPVPAMLSAPVPSPAPETATGVTESELVSAEPEDGPPIFESVRSGYLHAFGRDALRFSEQQAGQAPTGWPVRPPASWGDGGGRAVAGPPTAGRPASSGLPQPIPQPGQVRSAAADQETPPASVVESAEIAWRKLASFQRGSRRARMVARANRSAKQPGQNG